MDVWIIKETCLDRDYEVHGTRIGKEWTVIDIGAGIGEFTVLTAQENPSCTVFAYEPYPESFALLQENLVLNQVDNVVPFQLAVSASTEATISLATTGAAVQHTTLPNDRTGRASSQIEVERITLEQVFATQGIDRCDFMKVDCEGCEFEILLGAAPSTFERIERIALEYHEGFTEHGHEALVSHLEAQGYHVIEGSNPVHDYLGFLYAYRGETANG